MNTRHHDAAHRALPEDFIAWQTPWLLLLPTLQTETRRRHEELARSRPVTLSRHHRLYPEIVNRDVIDAVRVVARLPAPIPKHDTKEEVPSTFYMELNPKAAD